MREISDGDLGKVFNKFMNFIIRDFKINEGFDGSIVNCASNAGCDNDRGVGLSILVMLM